MPACLWLSIPALLKAWEASVLINRSAIKNGGCIERAGGLPPPAYALMRLLLITLLCLGSVLKEILLRLGTPKIIAALHDFGKAGKERIGFSLFLKIGYGGKLKVDIVVYQLFAAGNLGQIERGIDNGVKTSDMGDHNGGIKTALTHKLKGFDHIRGVSAGGAYDMGGGIMHIVEIEFRLEFGIGGACKEVEAAVLAQDSVALLHYGTHGGKHKHIVIAGAVGKLHELFYRIALAGIEIYKLDSVLSRRFGGEDGSRPVQTLLIISVTTSSPGRRSPWSA